MSNLVLKPNHYFNKIYMYACHEYRVKLKYILGYNPQPDWLTLLVLQCTSRASYVATSSPSPP